MERVKHYLKTRTRREKGLFAAVLVTVSVVLTLQLADLARGYAREAQLREEKSRLMLLQSRQAEKRVTAWRETAPDILAGYFARAGYRLMKGTDDHIRFSVLFASWEEALEALNQAEESGGGVLSQGMLEKTPEGLRLQVGDSDG